jgi:hypothetical protein
MQKGVKRRKKGNKKTGPCVVSSERTGNTKTDRTEEKERAMQNLKDAAVLLVLLLLVVSVKVSPIQGVGDVIPSVGAASTDSAGGIELAGFPAGKPLPAAQFGPAPSAELPNSEMNQVQVQVEAETYRCDSSMVHVQTLEFGDTGKRIILRIDTSDGRAQVERVDTVEPAPRTSVIEACKIG